MSCSYCNGYGCSSCRVCPTCDSSLPDTCEFLQAIPIGTTLVVEDSAGCKRSLIPPTSTSVLQQNAAGDVEWHDGSVDNPFCLPNTQLQSGGTISGVLALNSSGCLVDYSADSPTDLQVLTQDGSTIEFESLATAIIGAAGDGCGVLVRDCDPAESDLEFKIGTEGQILQTDGSGNPVWADLSNLGVGVGIRTLQAQYVSSSSLSFTIKNAIVFDASGNSTRVNTASQTVDITTAGLNGLDTGVEAINTWYYFYVIYNPTTLTIGGLLSINSTTPTLPTDYTYFRVIGAVRNGSNGNFVAFFQAGNLVFVPPQLVLDDVTGQNSYTAVSLANFVPQTAIAVKGIIGDTNDVDSIQASFYVAGSTAGLGESGGGGSNGIDLFNDFSASVEYNAPLLTSQTAYWRSAPTTDIIRMTVTGYTLNF